MDNNLMTFVKNMQQTYDHIEDIVFIKDLTFRYVYVNHKFIQYAPPLKISDDTSFIGLTDYQLYDTALASDYGRTDRIVKETRKPINYDVMVEYENEIGYFNLSKNPIYSRTGELIGIFGIARNITPHVKLRKKFEDNFNLINSIIDTIQFPIFVKDLDLKFTLVNDAFCKLHNLSKEEVIGNSDFELFDTRVAEKFRKKDLRVLENAEKEIYLFEDPLEPYHPRFQSSLTIKEPLKNSVGEITGILGIVNTALDLKEAQNIVIQEEKMNSLAKITGGIAHDLNNILLNVVGLSSFLVKKCGDPDLHSDLLTIQDAGMQASNLIKQLLMFAKRGTGKKEILNLDKIISQVLSLLRAEFENTIDINFTSESPINTIKGDRDQLTQVFLNFLINAKEAINDKGIIDIEISEVLYDNIKTINVNPKPFSDTSNYFKVKIRDNGEGVDSKIIGRIFEPYYSTKGENNSGLGLSIAYSVISKHGGFIDVIPLTQGTEFNIYLPVSEEKLQGSEGSKNDKIGDINNLGSVMVVDDNKDILMLIEAFLEVEGVVAHTFDNPYESVEFYREHQQKISVVILDLKMPGMSGDQVLLRLRKINPELKVLISSGFSEDEKLNAVKSQGVDGFLSKPYKKDDLVSKLYQILQKK